MNYIIGVLSSISTELIMKLVGNRIVSFNFKYDIDERKSSYQLVCDLLILIGVAISSFFLRMGANSRLANDIMHISIFVVNIMILAGINIFLIILNMCITLNFYISNNIIDELLKFDFLIAI